MNTITENRISHRAFKVLILLRASAMLKHVTGIGWTSVRPSVRHTLVLYQNG